MTYSEETKKVIIKKNPDDIIGPPSDRKIFSRQEMDAAKLAQKIIDDANAKAEKIINEKESEVEKEKKAGYQEGYREGLSSINKVLLELQNLKNNALITMEADIVKLAFKISRKILGYELEKNNDAIISIIREVLKASRHQKSIKLYVNPADLQFIKAKKEDLLSVLSKCESFIIEPGDHVTRGGCEIETEIGSISSNLDVQLEVLESLLLNKEI